MNRLLIRQAIDYKCGKMRPSLQNRSMDFAEIWPKFLSDKDVMAACTINAFKNRLDK